MGQTVQSSPDDLARGGYGRARRGKSLIDCGYGGGDRDVIYLAPRTALRRPDSEGREAEDNMGFLGFRGGKEAPRGRGGLAGGGGSDLR